MTKKELRQLYYLNREILHAAEELVNLKIESRIRESGEWGKRQEKMIAKREAEIVKKVHSCKGLRDRISRFIDSIDDSFVRQIFYYRFIKCMSWKKVAFMVGGGNTPDSVRKIADRYLNK